MLQRNSPSIFSANLDVFQATGQHTFLFFNQKKMRVGKSLPTKAITWSFLHEELHQINQILDRDSWGKGAFCCQVFFFLLLVLGGTGRFLFPPSILVFVSLFSSQANVRAGQEKLDKPDTKGTPRSSLDKDLLPQHKQIRRKKVIKYSINGL